MPLYEYRCANGHTFEIIRKFSDPPVETCPTCGSAVQKLMSSPAIQFKGTGWYVTDYARKGGEGKDPKGSNKESKDAGEKKEAGEKKDAGESKETKSEKSSSDSTSTTTSTSPASTPSTSKD